MNHLIATGFAAVVLLASSGCATTGASAPDAAASRPAARADDPWENWNRKVYAFNDAIDTAVIRPVATVYANVVPQPIRTGITNFYGNFADMWSAVNNLLQGKVADTAQDVARVSANTLFGIGGLFDVATDLGLDSQREDFGQTLGRWGVGPGPYVVWPFLGPSTLRDSAALPLDRTVGPALAFSDSSTQYSLTALGLLNERANLLPTTQMLDDMALDKYVFIRDAYLQRRRSLVYDGNEPESDEESFDPEPDAPPVAAEAASAPASGVAVASAVAPGTAASAVAPAAPASAASQSSN